MTKAAFSARMDKELKDEFEKTCRSFGINMTAAINQFATAVVNERRIPFEIRSKTMTRSEALRNFESTRGQAQAANPNGMPLEDIHELIAESRSQDK